MSQRHVYPRKVIPAKCSKKVVVTTLPDGVLIQIKSGMAVMSKEQVQELIQSLTQ